MQTIQVVYTDTRLTKKEYQTMKRYCFNTKSAVKIGDLIETDQYDTPMQVVEIGKPFKYVNISTGEMSNKRQNSTRQYEIRNLVVKKDKESEDIIGTVLGK